MYCITVVLLSIWHREPFQNNNGGQTRVKSAKPFVGMGASKKIPDDDVMKDRVQLACAMQFPRVAIKIQRQI
jgi:hypothetical protein